MEYNECPDWNEIEPTLLANQPDEGIEQQGPFMGYSNGVRPSLPDLPFSPPTGESTGCNNCYSLMPRSNRQQIEEFHPNICNGTDLVNRSGDYGFKLEAPDASPKFAYSPVAERLYCQMTELVPLQVLTERPLPSTVHLNVFIVYDDQAYRAENVEACPHHRDLAKKNKLNNPDFVIRAGDTENVEYVEFPSGFGLSVTDRHFGDKRHVVRFPLAPGLSAKYIRVKFMCRTSCTGGMNRRPTTLVGVLCSSTNAVLGMSFVKLKIVSSPARDVRKVGEKAQKLNQHAQDGSISHITRSNNSSSGNDNSISRISSGGESVSSRRPLRTKTKSGIAGREVAKREISDAEGGASSDTEEVFVLHVRGKRNYQMLMTMAEGLELRRQTRRRKREPKPSNTDNCDTHYHVNSHSNNYVDANNNDMNSVDVSSC